MIFYVLSVVGLLWSALVLYFVILAQQTRRWPSTTGQIVEAEVREVRSRSTSSTPGSISYMPLVTYEYEVGGEVLRSAQITFGAGKTFRDRAAAELELSRYPVGCRLPVYYDPARPRRAVLQQGSSSGQLAGLLFGFGILLVGVIGVVYQWQ
jgi:hypothetical protein